MNPNTIPALLISLSVIVAAAIGAAAFALSDRYSTEVTRGVIVRTDHLTGKVVVCGAPRSCNRWLPDAWLIIDKKSTAEAATAEAAAAAAAAAD